MARSDDVRLRIVKTAFALLQDGGREAVSTRAVTSALKIQAPTLYRIFGDKQGLLDATAAYGFASHLSTWDGPQPDTDPAEALRQGWDMHVQWGLENPQLYSIAYGDGRVGTRSPASTEIDAILRTLIEQAAADGRVSLPVDHAVDLLRAIGSGVVFTLLAMPPDARDLSLSTRAREVALSSFLVEDTDAASRSRSGTAMQLKAELGTDTVLRDNERALLGDWLDRLALDG